MRTTKTIRCALCRTEVEVDYRSTSVGARWLALPRGWMVLLDCIGGEPHCRCSGCAPRPRPELDDTADCIAEMRAEHDADVRRMNGDE